MAAENKLTQRLILGLTLPLVILNGWVLLQLFNFFQPLVSIIIAASILAFLLNYAVRFLVARGVKSGYAALGVFLLAVSMFSAVALTIVPIALGQLTELAKRLPSWLDSGTQQLQTLQLWAASQDIQVDLSGIAIRLTDKLSGQLQGLTGKILSFAFDTVGSIVNVLVTIVLTFYLLLRGDRIWAGIFQWFPTNLGKQIQNSLQQNFKNYYIGQATLASLIGTVITLSFLALDVPFGLLFGLGIGVMSLVPFGGTFTASLITLLLALEDFWLAAKVLSIFLIIEQAVGNVVAPRILGNLTGLNPAWVLVSLLTGVKLAGALGLVIAVPIASSIKGTAESFRNQKLAVEQPEQLEGGA